MKIFKAIAVVALCTGLMIGTNSCLHVVHQDNARQGGWYKQKNSNNPHHPNTTNPGHTKAPKQSKAKPKKGPKN